MDPLIEPEELLEQLNRDQPPLVIDVRSEKAYQEGHISSAIHIPSQEVGKRLAEIPRDRNIVTY